MKKYIATTATALSLGLALAACNQPASTNPSGDGGRIKICPADQMQGLVGKKASEASKFLGKVPADERTPTYYIGEKQGLPDSVTRGSTLVVLNTPMLNSSPDLSAYTVKAVKCFTGAEWNN